MKRKISEERNWILNCEYSGDFSMTSGAKRSREMGQQLEEKLESKRNCFLMGGIAARVQADGNGLFCTFFPVFAHSVPTPSNPSGLRSGALLL